MEKLTNRLCKENAFYWDIRKEKWLKVTSFNKKIDKNSMIKIADLSFCILDYTYDLGYFFGLSIGSKYSCNKSFKIVIERTQLEFINKFTKEIGVIPIIEEQKKKRKSYKKNFYKYYRKTYVSFPYSFKRYLRAMGMFISCPKILPEFPDEMKLGIIAGLFDSRRAYYYFHNDQFGIHEYVKLSILNSRSITGMKLRYYKDFIEQIKKILLQLGIQTTSNEDGITISGKGNLTLLFKHFGYKKVKSIAMATLLELRSIESYYTTIINLYPLTEMDLTIWGYLLHNLYINYPERVAYSCLESVMKVGSQIVRQSLYKLHELGCINYFVRGKKEFISNSDRVIEKTKNALKDRYRTVVEKSEDIYLKCPNCSEEFDYLSFFDKMDFRCPNCCILLDLEFNSSNKDSRELRKLTKFINSVLECDKKRVSKKSIIIMNEKRLKKYV